MARTKPQQMITTRAQAEDALSTINRLDEEIAAMIAAEAAAVQSARKRHADLQRQKDREGKERTKVLLVKELERFAEQDSATWEKKTYETPFGRMGFRVSNPAVVLIKRVAKSLQDALILLMDNGLKKFVKQAPSIDKEGILAADREGKIDRVELAKCGLAVEQKDEFWVESNASKALDDAAKELKACSKI